MKTEFTAKNAKNAEKTKTKLFPILFVLFAFFAVKILAQSAGPGSSKTIRFLWDNNTEIDLAGYVFYYGIVGGVTNSVQVATNTITLLNLANGRYWFGCTAKNTNNLESDFSNIVLASVPRNPSNLRIP